MGNEVKSSKIKRIEMKFKQKVYTKTSKCIKNVGKMGFLSETQQIPVYFQGHSNLPTKKRR